MGGPAARVGYTRKHQQHNRLVRVHLNVVVGRAYFFTLEMYNYYPQSHSNTS